MPYVKTLTAKERAYEHLFVCLKKQKQCEIAKLLNISQPTVSRKIKKLVFTYDELVKIFEFLKIPKESIGEFFM
ncbi:MAG: ArsR family transcriptional regulator [Lachnospiraceae bacterium]|nr:ArsR family transcriptional regulator [Lachnospiraceae bacterium]